MLDAEAGEHPDEVLGGEVAGGALGVGAAAQTAGRRVERRDAVPQRGAARWRAPGRTCRGSAWRAGRRRRRPHRTRRARRPRGRRCRRRSCRRARAGWRRGRAVGVRRRRPGRSAPGPPTGRRSTSRRRRARRGRRPARARRPARTSRTGRRAELLRFFFANVSVALPKIATCVQPAASARSSPRSLGTSTGSGTGPSSGSRATSSSASASCGTHFGWTKLVASTIGSPAATSRCDELGLDVERHDRALVLQPVARPDLVDRHPRRAATGRAPRPAGQASVSRWGLDGEQQVPLLHLLAGGCADVGDDAVVRGGERELHLHRLERAEVLTSGDDVALGDVDRQDGGRHRGGDVGITRSGEVATAHRVGRDEQPRLTLPGHRDAARGVAVPQGRGRTAVASTQWVTPSASMTGTSRGAGAPESRQPSPIANGDPVRSTAGAGEDVGTDEQGFGRQLGRRQQGFGGVAVEPPGVDGAFGELRRAHQAAHEPQVRLHAEDGRVVECVEHQQPGGLAVGAVHDDLARSSGRMRS